MSPENYENTSNCEGCGLTVVVYKKCIFFNSKLEAKGGKPLWKRKSIAKLVEIKETLDIGDILKVDILHIDRTMPPNL